MPMIKQQNLESMTQRNIANKDLVLSRVRSMQAQFEKYHQYVTLVCNRGALDMGVHTYAILLNGMLDENA